MIPFIKTTKMTEDEFEQQDLAPHLQEMMAHVLLFGYMMDRRAMMKLNSIDADEYERLMQSARARVGTNVRGLLEAATIAFASLARAKDGEIMRTAMGMTDEGDES